MTNKNYRLIPKKYLRRQLLVYLGEGLSEDEQFTRTTQVTLKVPTTFIDRFDKVTEALGYSRTEAIRESMRRFLEVGEIKLKERPEEAFAQMKMFMDALMGSIIQVAEKVDSLESPKKVQSLPNKINE